LDKDRDAAAATGKRLLDECNQLGSIIAQSIVTAKENREKLRTAYNRKAQ